MIKIRTTTQIRKDRENIIIKFFLWPYELIGIIMDKLDELTSNKLPYSIKLILSLSIVVTSIFIIYKSVSVFELPKGLIILIVIIVLYFIFRKRK